MLDRVSPRSILAPVHLWRAFALIGAATFAITGVALGVSVAPLAFDADRAVREVAGLTAGDLLSDDGITTDGVPALDDLAEIRTTVALLADDVRSARGVTHRIWTLSPALSWVPAAGREMGAWAAATRRIDLDVVAASRLLDTSSTLMEAYSRTGAALLTPGSEPSPATLREQVAGTEPGFAAAGASLASLGSDEPMFGLAMQVAPVRRATSLLEQAEVRMASLSSIGQGLSGLVVQLLGIAELARPLIGQLAVESDDVFEPWSVAELRLNLEDIAARIQDSLQITEEIEGLVSHTGEGVELLPRLAELRTLLEALDRVDSAASLGLMTIGSALEGVGGSENGPDAGDGRFLTVARAINGRLEDIDEALDDLALARNGLESLDAGGSATAGQGLAALSSLVDDLESGFRLLRRFAPAGEELLGAGGPRRYLVLGQSSDELRATGGFVSSVWLVTLDRGRIAEVLYEDTVRVDDWEQLALYPKAPPGLEEHMNAWVWLMRDVSWEPDFPTAALTAEGMYRIGQRQDVDGVIAINQWSLLHLVEAMGSIPSPVDGEPITARNLLSVLETGTDAHGTAYVDVVVQGLLDALDKPLPLSRLMRLATGLRRTLEERDTLVFVNDPAVGTVFGENLWDGSVRQDSTDYLYVVDSNVGWSKSDRSIQRLLYYEIDLARASRPRATLTLRYRNHSGPGSPGCMPQWQHRGKDYSQLKNACYWDFLRVLFPLDARLLFATPMPLPELSVSAEIGMSSPGTDTGRLSSSHGRSVYSGLTFIEAGDSAEVALVYDLPQSVLSHDDGALTYRLVLQKQPGVREREITVALIVPDGYELEDSSVAPARRVASRIEFTFVLSTDVTLSVSFAPEQDG